MDAGGCRPPPSTALRTHSLNNNMNDADETTTTTTCANCGKGEESSGDLRACVACKLVKYCNRECQIAHRPQHKKICKKRAAELHDEALFKEQPPTDDCLICSRPLPLEAGQMTFESCCGNIICAGCIYVMMEEDRKKGELISRCAFCRALPTTSAEGEVERLRKLMKSENSHAFHVLGGRYEHGDGVPQDFGKANELYLRAGELGCSDGYCNLGYSYRIGRGVEVDKKKAKYYYELAAMNGNVTARHNLGSMEGQAGNIDRAFKHCILAAKAGYKDSLDKVKAGFTGGVITKDEYANTLRAYHKIQNEMKSEGRDKAREL